MVLNTTGRKELFYHPTMDVSVAKWLLRLANESGIRLRIGIRRKEDEYSLVFSPFLTPF